jgi:DNA-binding transcriptional MocR family regulator
MLCHRFVTERDLDGHIEMIRAIYRRKCGIMMKGLDENLPKSFKFTRPEGGLFVWCTLPEGIDMTEFVARCLKNKLAIVPGTAFGDCGEGFARISYAYSVKHITEALARMEKFVNKLKNQ